MAKETEKPSIVICVDENFNENHTLQNILYGIEEEDVFFLIKSATSDSAVVLAARAALESRLEVGIGIDNMGNIALHYKNMKEPLFFLKFGMGVHEDAQRSLGTNAARLVKGVPLIV
ncbi:MAG: glycerol dehydratase reactivase beta/small subunit family protein [Defluviitaleaceae bacterium]|nr:glycerol dehydratase reactivase beta/small subunit family protein [Defluviitaleaceae bacterium]